MKKTSINQENQKSYEGKKMIKNYALLGTVMFSIGAVLFLAISGAIAYLLIHLSGSALGFLAGLWYVAIMAWLIIGTINIKQSIEKDLQENVLKNLKKWQQEKEQLARQVTMDSQK